MTIVDGDQPGGGDEDLLRISIWDESGVLYDDQPGDPVDAYPTRVIADGKIKFKIPKDGK